MAGTFVLIFISLYSLSLTELLGGVFIMYQLDHAWQGLMCRSQWDLWKQEPPICKSRHCLFSQPGLIFCRHNLAGLCYILLQDIHAVQIFCPKFISNSSQTWILTDTNSSGRRKQDIFFFLPLSLIPRSNIAANVSVKNLSNLAHVLQNICTIS